jgi:large subunit ribosomal protein L30
MSGQIKITLRRSGIGGTPRQREVLRGLGLRRINASVLRPDSPAIRGMVTKVSHLVEVETLPDGRREAEAVATGWGPIGLPHERERDREGAPKGDAGRRDE